MRSHAPIRRPRTGAGPRARAGAGVAAIAALGLASALAGCTDAVDQRPATWRYVHAAIIVPGCTTVNCHSELTERAGFDLSDREKAYGILVGAACANGPMADGTSRNFVDPGAPETSKLMYMLRAEDVVRMPPDNALPEAEIALVEQWILEGALCE